MEKIPTSIRHAVQGGNKYLICFWTNTGYSYDLIKW